MKIPATHFDDRAEAAVVRAAARRLDDVDRTSEKRVALEHARRPIRRLDVRLQMTHVPGRRAVERVTVPIGQPRHVGQRGTRLEGADERAKRVVTLAAHDRIDAGVRRFVHLGRQARVVAADDDPDVGLEAPNERDHFQGGVPLERHDRQPDDVRRTRRDQAADGARDVLLREDEVGDGDVVMQVEVAGQRGQCTVRHAHRQGRRVLERVGHREEQDVHGRPGSEDSTAARRHGVRLTAHGRTAHGSPGTPHQ
jgi:hypothetical protein